MLVKLFLIMVGLGLSTALSAAPVIKTQQAPVSNREACVACHQADGNSVVPMWPKITQQPVSYFIEQMQEFKKGEEGRRYNPNMLAIVQNLTDEDIAEMAMFYSEQPTTPGVTAEKWVSLGEKIYRGGNLKTGVTACAACHSPQGLGNRPAGFPRLSGQHPEYIIDQLEKFSSGERSNDKNGIMRDISQRMTDEEIAAVAHYVSGLY